MYLVYAIFEAEKGEIVTIPHITGVGKKEYIFKSFKKAYENYHNLKRDNPQIVYVIKRLFISRRRYYETFGNVARANKND